MQINRQNYEQYFLLYADGELTASQRIIVELFVAENNDLARELTMIQAAILPQEEIKLLDKNFLYKSVDYKTQEKLLLKLHNELPAAELAIVDTLIQNNSTAKDAYNLLSNTILDKNEKVIFEHKHLLYKKEKDNVVVFGFLRWAAAAIFIGFAVFTGIKFYNNKNNVEPATANATKEIKPQNKKVETIENNINQNTNNKIKDNNIAQSKLENFAPKQRNLPKQIFNNAENKIVVQKNVNDKNTVTNKNNKRIITKQDESIALDKKDKFLPSQNFVFPPSNNNTLQEMQAANTNNSNIAKTINTERLYELENTYAYQNVVQKIEDITENKILYINEYKVKKSKIGMFFSRIKTAVQKTAKIKPGSSIQVAGFEISGN